MSAGTATITITVTVTISATHVTVTVTVLGPGRGPGLPLPAIYLPPTQLGTALVHARIRLARVTRGWVNFRGFAAKEGPGRVLSNVGQAGIEPARLLTLGF